MVDNSRNDLVTPRSLQLSLYAPRAPPYGTIHHSRLSNKVYCEDDELPSEIKRQSPPKSNLRFSKTYLPHPHIPNSLSWGENLTRGIGSRLPLSVQNKLRDSGAFRAIVDGLVTLNAPLLVITDPYSAIRFVRLSWNMTKISYGSHPMQYIHLFEPDKNKFQEKTGFVFFVVSFRFGNFGVAFSSQ